MATAPQAIPSWIRSSAVSGRVAWEQVTLHGIILCDHPAQPGSSQSEQRSSGIAPDESTAYHGLSKARRDRGSRHDRYNHPVHFSGLDCPYQAPTNDPSKGPPIPATGTIRRPPPRHSGLERTTTVLRRYPASRSENRGNGPAASSPRTNDSADATIHGRDTDHGADRHAGCTPRIPADPTRPPSRSASGLPRSLRLAWGHLPSPEQKRRGTGTLGGRLGRGRRQRSAQHGLAIHGHAGPPQGLPAAVAASACCRAARPPAWSAGAR